MSLDIAAILLQDGLTNGAIYVLLAVVLVLIFTVTRIVFVPQGDLVALSALTLADFELGHRPGVVWILGPAAGVALILELIAARGQLRLMWRPAIEFGVVPGLVILLALFAVPKDAPLLWKMVVTCGLITVIAPILYRIAFQPMAEASPLVLLIAAEIGRAHV